MRNVMTVWLSLWLLVVLSPHQALGSLQQGEEKNQSLAAEEEGAEETHVNAGLIDISHARASGAVLASARWIDSFFSDERVVREETETRLRLGLMNYAQEGDLFDADVRTNIRLDLPLAGERLRLFFSGEDDEFDRVLYSPDERSRQPVFASRDRRASVGVRYYLRSTLHNNLSLSSGLRFRSGSPILYLEPRFRHLTALGDWDLRFTQRFAALSTGRIEVRTSFDLERPWEGRYFVRGTVEGGWFDDEDGYFYGLHFSLYQPLSRRRMLLYSWRNSFATRPNHVLEEVRLITSYRQKIWREWMYVEVSPQLAFPREHNYDISPGILLRLDIIIGHFKLYEGVPNPMGHAPAETTSN